MPSLRRRDAPPRRGATPPAAGAGSARLGARLGALLALASALAAVLAAAPAPAAAEAPATESSVQAAFLFNFVKFVEWPEGALPAAAPLVLGVLGDGAFAEALDEAVREKSVDGHPLRVRHLDEPGELRRAGALHVLFLPEERAGELDRALAVAAGAGHGLLTVGVGREFAGAGGVIALVRVGGKVRFEINDEAARRAGLLLSSKLLRLAARVHGAPAAGAGGPP